MEQIFIPLADGQLASDVDFPSGRQCAQGMVVFVHGSGVDRHDARNRAVAQVLSDAGFATVLIDLLRPRESRERHNVFDVEGRARRLAAALEWLQEHFPLATGLFGTGVGAGVALLAAARHPARVSAIVLRGGRPDTASFSLAAVEAPTLFIADGPDREPWSRQAMARMAGTKDLVIVPSPSQLFEEPGAIGAVADHARRWFSRYVGVDAAAPSTERTATEAPDIVFVGLAPSDALEAVIRDEAANLASLCPQIKSCRVTVEEHAPRAHERKRFNVGVDIRLADREILINREDDAAPLAAAREAFGSASHQLRPGAAR
jgi:putative phosphoribosyl transferase